MSKMTFAKFVDEVAIARDLAVAPWQKQLVEMFEDRGEIFPGMPTRDMRWEFHWMTQLMWMRACWMQRIETAFYSGHFELLKTHHTTMIFDEFCHE